MKLSAAANHTYPLRNAGKRYLMQGERQAKSRPYTQFQDMWAALLFLSATRRLAEKSSGDESVYRDW